MERVASDRVIGVVLQEGDRPGDYQLIDDGNSNRHFGWLDLVGRMRRDSLLVRIGTPPASAIDAAESARSP